MSEQDDLFRAGFQAGFAVSREGFNGECAYEHCGPEPDDVATFADEWPNEAALDALLETARLAYFKRNHREP